MSSMSTSSAVEPAGAGRLPRFLCTNNLTCLEKELRDTHAVTELKDLGFLLDSDVDDLVEKHDIKRRDEQTLRDEVEVQACRRRVTLDRRKVSVEKTVPREMQQEAIMQKLSPPSLVRTVSRLKGEAPAVSPINAVDKSGGEKPPRGRGGRGVRRRNLSMLDQDMPNTAREKQISEKIAMVSRMANITSGHNGQKDRDAWDQSEVRGEWEVLRGVRTMRRRSMYIHEEEEQAIHEEEEQALSSTDNYPGQVLYQPGSVLSELSSESGGSQPAKRRGRKTQAKTWFQREALAIFWLALFAAFNVWMTAKTSWHYYTHPVVPASGCRNVARSNAPAYKLLRKSQRDLDSCFAESHPRVLKVTLDGDCSYAARCCS